MRSSNQTASAAVWSTADILANHFARFAFTVFLSRLLSPADFGMIGSLGLLLAIAGVLTEGGLATALVQKRQLSEVDLATAFWITTCAGCLMGLAIYGATKLVDVWLVPGVGSFAGSISFIPVLAGLSSVHRALATRELKFRAIFSVSLLSTVISGLAGVTLGTFGCGAWALVAQSVVAAATTSAALWVVHPWMPSPAFSRSSAKELWRFGGFVMGASLLDVIYNKASSIFIPKYFGSDQLGYFIRAESTAALPASVLSGTVSRVALPLLSMGGNVADGMKATLANGLKIAMCLNVPLISCFSALSDNLVPLLYGENWAASAPLVKILCIPGLFMPMHIINLQAILAAGKSAVYFKLELAKKAFGASALAIGISYGVEGLAWGYAAGSLASLAVNCSKSSRLLKYSFLGQIQDVLPSIVAGAGLFVTVSEVAKYLGPLSSIAFGSAVSLAMVLLLFKFHGIQFLRK